MMLPFIIIKDDTTRRDEDISDMVDTYFLVWTQAFNYTLAVFFTNYKRADD